jgi:hypothetical protein
MVLFRLVNGAVIPISTGATVARSADTPDTDRKPDAEDGIA